MTNFSLKYCFSVIKPLETTCKWLLNYNKDYELWTLTQIMSIDTYPLQPTVNDQEIFHYISLICSYEIMVANKINQKLLYKSKCKTKFHNYYLSQTQTHS